MTRLRRGRNSVASVSGEDRSAAALMKLHKDRPV
jgi:hypothetical protein